MITTVAFDLDDTLYDEIDYCKSGFKMVAEFLSKQGRVKCAKTVFDALWQQFTSGNRRETFNKALVQLGIDHNEDFIDKLVTTYRNHVPQITLPRDSSNILSTLSGKYTLALLTDGFLPGQKLKVHALGIENYFKCIIYTEDLGREFWKPSEAGFKELMKRLHAQPENTAYVGDNEKKDFIAPNKMGILTIQLIRNARIHTTCAKTPEASAQYVIHEIHELPAILEKV